MKNKLPILALSLLSSIAFADNGHDSESHHSHNITSTPSAGYPGMEADVTRIIEVNMDDNMRFSPESLNVDEGETVRLLVRNLGSVEHELVIGDSASLLEHAEMMRNMPEMEHEEPNMITLQPGEEGALLWSFEKAGVVDFACLIPGHFEAGMKGHIQVQ